MFRLFNTIFVVFILAISFVVILSALGWVRIFVVKSGSMTPTLPINSLVIVVPTKSIFNSTAVGYKVNDVISFKPTGEKAIITHRIIGVKNQNDNLFYSTKGDANSSNDVWKLSKNNILGKVAFSFADVGTLVSLLNSFLGLFILVIIPATFVILHEVLVIQAELKRVSEANNLKLSKKTLAGSIVILLFLVLAAPAYALFSSSVLLDSNSLSTKESFLADHIVINEVYYQVDREHGKDSSLDRKSGSYCGTQNNSANVNNNVSVNNSTGGNNSSDNTGGNTSINTGSSSANININNNVNQNTNNCSQQNNEWVELYNPTGADVALKSWSFTDNSGKVTKIPGNKTIKSHQFALVSKDNSTWSFWNTSDSTLKIELGVAIGDGLGNSGDKLILKNSQGHAVDSLSYGSDNSVFNPSIPLVVLGSSFERLTAGLDNERAVDFIERHSPTPGN